MRPAGASRLAGRLGRRRPPSPLRDRGRSGRELHAVRAFRRVASRSARTAARRAEERCARAALPRRCDADLPELRPAGRTLARSIHAPQRTRPRRRVPARRQPRARDGALRRARARCRGCRRGEPGGRRRRPAADGCLLTRLRGAAARFRHRRPARGAPRRRPRPRGGVAARTRSRHRGHGAGDRAERRPPLHYRRPRLHAGRTGPCREQRACPPRPRGAARRRHRAGSDGQARGGARRLRAGARLHGCLSAGSTRRAGGS